VHGAAVVKPFFDSARQAWESQGRKGSPKLVAIAYYTFGGVDQGRANIRDYNLALGADHAEAIRKPSLSDARVSRKWWSRSLRLARTR
jgi:hypothetical protein